MGKPRVFGNNATVQVKGTNGTAVTVGEIDRFSAKSLDELKTSQALGQKAITSQVQFKGWELSFDGGKVDWQLANLIHGQDAQIFRGGVSPTFRVLQTIKHFDGSYEQWVWDNVTIHGYELEMSSEDQITEKFSGFCGQERTKGGGTNGAVASNATVVDTDVANIINAMNGTQYVSRVTDSAGGDPFNSR